MSHNEEAEFSAEQLEHIHRVWEKNNIKKVFTHVGIGTKVYPESVRVLNVFNDRSEGWCVSFEDVRNNCPTYFKPFNVFINEYIHVK